MVKLDLCGKDIDDVTNGVINFRPARSEYSDVELNGEGGVK